MAFKDSFHFGFPVCRLRTGIVDDIEASHAAATNTKKEVERQKGLLPTAWKAAKNDLIDAASLRTRVLVVGTHETEPFFSTSAASGQIS